MSQKIDKTFSDEKVFKYFTQVLNLETKTTWGTDYCVHDSDYNNITPMQYQWTTYNKSTDESIFSGVINNSLITTELITYKDNDVLTVDNVLITKFALMTEERLEEYITDNIDIFYFNEYNSYVYQVIQEKAYEFASKIVEEAKKEYKITESDILINNVLDEIDFDSLYDLVDCIFHGPLTSE